MTLIKFSVVVYMEIMWSLILCSVISGGHDRPYAVLWGKLVLGPIEST